ncbi:MAG TPA: hypothetical protein VGG75_37365 [Trebonia sp.]|jgi:hypothetical protein
MRISRRVARRAGAFLALTVAVAGLCAASGSAATARNPVPARAAGTRAAVADTQASTDPPINVGLYQACDDPSDWQTETPPVPTSANLAGWADTAKLGGSLPLGSPEPALSKSAGSGEGNQLGAVIIGSTTYACTLVRLQLDYHGLRELPPARATFLAYGVEPVTATVQFVQTGPRDFSACVDKDGTTSPDCPPVTAVVAADDTNGTPEYNDYQVVSTAQLSLRISDVSVNGTPLDVGGSCQTGPVTTEGNPLGYDGVVLTGGNQPGDPAPQYAQPAYGGALDGSATVPPVTGCGANGDLDPLLTSAISGPGNYVRFLQSVLCSGTSLSTDLVVGACAPDGTTPTVGPLWTVTNGGAFTASGPVAMNVGAGLKPEDIKCVDSTLSASIADSGGPPRGNLGTVTSWTSGDCAGYGRTGTADGSTWTITASGTGAVAGVGPNAVSGTSTEGDTILDFDGIGFTLRGWGGTTGATAQDPCQITVSGGQVGVVYTNPAASSAAMLQTMPSANFALHPSLVSSTCSNVAAGSTVTQPSGDFTLHTGSGVTITNLPPPSS